MGAVLQLDGGACARGGGQDCGHTFAIYVDDVLPRHTVSATLLWKLMLGWLPAYPGLLVKDSYWRWPERMLAGNAIDIFMRVLGLSFHDSMRAITGR